MTLEQKKLLISPTYTMLSIRQQCELLDLNRSSLYYREVEENNYNLLLMNLIDEEYTRHPFLGKRRMRDCLAELGYDVGVKRTRTLMAWLGLEAIYPKKSTSVPNREHKKYPYLLKRLPIIRPNQVSTPGKKSMSLPCV